MKSVLISIQPKYCELIANGKKTVEVKKAKPKIDVPFKCYIYMTRGKPTFEQSAFRDEISNGKVIGEFICDRIYYIKNLVTAFSIDYDEKLTNRIGNASCLDFWDMRNYLQDKDGYAWHISELVIHDEPKLLEKFFKPCGNCDKKGTMRCTEEITPCRATKITRPPQSYCYVEELGV